MNMQKSFFSKVVLVSFLPLLFFVGQVHSSTRKTVTLPLVKIPTPTLAPSLTPTPIQTIVYHMVDLANADRSEYKLPALRENSLLDKSAKNKACDMAVNNYFSHNSPTGKTPWDFIHEVGYDFQYAGENLAKGYADAQEAEAGWMKSPGHKANILGKQFKEIGVAMCGAYYVQHFGTLRQ